MDSRDGAGVVGEVDLPATDSHGFSRIANFTTEGHRVTQEESGELPACASLPKKALTAENAEVFAEGAENPLLL